MRTHALALCVIVPTVLIMALASHAPAADWPTFRHDPARSGVSPEDIPASLHLQWTHRPRHAPVPAWPEPVQEMHRMPFDYAYQVAATGGMVYFGSSADHKVYALDAATGKERWSFFTDAPVRFAPTVYEDRVLAASDDGYLYCLSADSGELLWKFRGGPRDEMLLGNGHIISRWPLRTGVAVADGVAYFAAGMWPAEGVYLYALRVADGEIVWENDSSGSLYIRLPHPTAEGFSGVAPQGNIVVYEDILFVPTGRSVPAAFDRRTGRLLYYKPGWPTYQLRQGGSWVCAAADLVFCGVHPGGPDIDVLQGPREPTSGDGLGAWNCATGDVRFDLRGKHRLVVRDDALYCSGSGKVSAYDLGGLRARKKRDQCVRWEADHGRVFSLIVARNAVVVGGRGTVTAYDSASGEVLWSGEAPGEVRGLALSDGRLLASIHTGEILCFDARSVAEAAVVSPARPAFSPGGSRAVARDILERTGITEGYCLLLGVSDGHLAGELAWNSELQIYCLDPDAEEVARARATLDAAGLYGVRVTVHQGEYESLPYPDYFADVVIAGPGITGELGSRAIGEIYRVTRPCGGIACLLDASISAVKAALQEANAPQDFMRVTPGAIHIVRGALPGAGEWTHQYADAGRAGCSEDQRVKWPLKLLWFGGPGPAGMLNRHWRAAAPLSTNGRVFIAGQHTVLAVNAYNGRELWRRELRSVARRGVHAGGGNLAADQDSVYAVIGGVCLRLDAATGETRQVYHIPTQTPRFALDRPQTFDLIADEQHSGAVTLEATAEGLIITLVTTDDKVTNHRRDAGPAPGQTWQHFIEGLISSGEKILVPALGDGWELFLDFRPAKERGGLYGRGAFQTFITPATIEQASASSKPAVGPAHPKLTVEGALTDIGSKTTVLLPWAEVGALVGEKPADFAFGVILNCSDDGDKLAMSARKFASRNSYRLTSGWGAFVLDPAAAPQTPANQSAMLPAEISESYVWGSPAVIGDLVLGTAGAVPVPHYIKYWSTLRTPTESRYVFALNKDDGSLRWLHEAKHTIAHTAIAIADGHVCFMDRTSKEELEQMKRRGEPATEDVALVALDLDTGKELWRTQESLTGRDSLLATQGVVLAAGRRALSGHAADTGESLWTRSTSSRGFTVIAGDVIYAEPNAFDLKTGQPITRKHPLTGEPVSWSFRRAYGCGGISGSAHTLFFRSGVMGFCDLAGDSGTHNFGGVRPGCHVNVIAANGLALAPEASSSCTCAYNYQTSVAFMPTQTRPEDWSVFSVPTGSGTRIKQVAVNLGATGDHRDGEGNMWLSFPRPIYPAATPLPMLLECASFHRRNAEDLRSEGIERPWLYASGCEGLREAVLDLTVGEPVVAAPCPAAPKIDGILDDPCWDGRHPVRVADEQRNRVPRISAFARSDADCLYLSFECKAAIRDGAPIPWKADTQGEDASVWGDDSWQVFLTDRARKAYLRLGVSASGARYDARCTYASTNAIDNKWNGEWTHGVATTPQAWSLEMAVPWKTLVDAGLKRDSLRLNILGYNRTGVGPERMQLRYPGMWDFDRCELFSDVHLAEPAEPEARSYTVRLHFIEPRDIQPGEAVFDIKLQGETVLEGLDVIADAGARDVPVVEEFAGIRAGDTLRVELVPRAEDAPARDPAVLAAMEVREE